MRSSSIFSASARVAAALLAAGSLLASPRAGVAGETARLTEALAPIAGVVEDEVRAGHIPGAVVVVGHQGEVVFRGAYGARALTPSRRAMTVDTVFDLASLTKVVATTTAVMQLMDAGALDLDDPVARYWPAFAASGKQRITVRQLLSHGSGLPAGLSRPPNGSARRSVLARVAAQPPLAAPGARFEYSDVNFIVLGELVRRLGGLPLDRYCALRVFAPLGMGDTVFRPPASARERVAPTTRWGTVHDPIAYRMGGVAGHAGLFSTADDLARFAQMLLDGGRTADTQVLSSEAVALMTSVHSHAGDAIRRGLGWDLGLSFDPSWAAAGRRVFGHTGYTGTSLWIDPETRTYVIILTNRSHLPEHGDANPLRRRIAATVGTALVQVQRAQLLPLRTQTGIDVLAAEGFAPLVGKRVGLITNDAARDSAGRRTASVLHGAAGVTLVRLFSPEHGLAGDREGRVGSARDAETGLPVVSLYDGVKRPPDASLTDLDALVFDLQDAGARFYTYATTMAYAMEAAARRGLSFYVLDRPNPLNAAVVQGPVLEEGLQSFTGYFSLPVRHGMTVGELARLFNEEKRLGLDLRVVAMRGYRREQWFDETGLRWSAPSPNLRTLGAAFLYPGVGLLEGANVSVGRGTDTPFEVVGAPWIDGRALADYLTKRRIPGVRVEPIDFRPRADPFKGETCHGVRILLEDRQRVDMPELGVEIASALYLLAPARFDLDATTSMIGARWIVAALKAGTDPRSIARRWQASLDRFFSLRSPWLIY